jgi:LPS sulfotransferase NodH
MVGYALCTEARSGSTWLCRLLASTGVLGRPTEYFNAAAVRLVRSIADYPTDPEQQVSLIPTLGATPNGVYGLKLFSHHFDGVRSTRWAERLPGLCFVHLERRDLLAQAISHCRAMQTQQWSSSQQSLAEPVYRGEMIGAELVRLIQAQARWRYFLARNAPRQVHLFYEDALRNPQGAIAAIGRLVGLEQTPRIDPGVLSGLDIQRDELSQAWRRRYLSENHDLTRFD